MSLGTRDAMTIMRLKDYRRLRTAFYLKYLYQQEYYRR
jgi:hypothetical protein